MTDVQKILLPLLVLVFVLCLVSCVPTPPAGGEDSTAKTEDATNSPTENVTETENPTAESTSDQVSEQITEPVTETTAEEETTYGELHFPESGE